MRRNATGLPRVFDRGLTDTDRALCCRSSAGSRRPRDHGWRSESWKTRRGHVFLVPGDSPVGLPAAAGLAAPCAEVHYPYINIADPTEPRGPCPISGPEALADQAAGVNGQAWPISPRRGSSDSDRTGAGRTRRRGAHGDEVEPRDGRLCVFMPPVERSRITSSWSRRPKSAAELGLRFISKATAADMIRASTSSASPRSRRDRGQHPSGDELGGMRRDHRRRL
jgi:uncharacterized protein (DUF2126 family)